MESLLVKESPLLLPLNKEKTVYDGFITVQERDFRIRILLPPDHQLKLAKLHCCWQLKQLLCGYGHIIKQRLHHSPDLVSFVLELKTVLEVALKSRPECHSIPPPQYYSRLILEMEDLGWDKYVLEHVGIGPGAFPRDLTRKNSGFPKTVYHVSSLIPRRVEYLRVFPAPLYMIDGLSLSVGVINGRRWEQPLHHRLVSIDTEFRTLRLRAEDSSGRQHVVTVKLKPKHPVEAPECSADLPVPLAMTWTPQIVAGQDHRSAPDPPLQSSLGHVHTQFLLLLESLAEFWAVLDEIDEKTWVLEPEKPSRADTMRRIAIANNVSIKVEVDTRHPKMLPECCLLGAEHVVTPLRNKLNANMHLWNPDCSILQNLRDVLEIEFPSPATHEKSSFSVECGICYAYRLESAIPDQVCNDPRCGQPFHQACLYEWLRGLPSSRQSFNIVFGECPYCGKPITVKMSTQKP